MSRQLELQLYLALNGYPPKDIPEERFDDYMREPHYTTDAEAMLELDREMRERGWNLELQIIGEYRGADYYHIEDEIGGDIQQADTEPLARALAAYKALTGKEWQD